MFNENEMTIQDFFIGTIESFYSPYFIIKSHQLNHNFFFHFKLMSQFECVTSSLSFVIYLLLANRICTTSRFNDQCAQLQRGTSAVNCQRVQDSIECAQRLRNGTADFGIFSAETALLLATMKYDGLTIIKELRHRDRLQRMRFHIFLFFLFRILLFNI